MNMSLALHLHVDVCPSAFLDRALKNMEKVKQMAWELFSPIMERKKKKKHLKTNQTTLAQNSASPQGGGAPEPLQQCACEIMNTATV